MYKDLSLKEKAKVLLYGGKLGLTSVEDIAKLYDDAISHKFAEGSIATPDWDPENPYHYHTASGEKVVITPEDWRRHKGLPYFKQVEDAVLTELAAHPGPEYIINPKFSEDLRMVYKGNMGPKYLNYSSFYGNLPQGYSFTPEGLVLDNQGNLYVLKGFRQTPRFTYDENNPLVFPVLEGRNQGNVTFYPVNMEKTLKKPLKVDKSIDFKPLKINYINSAFVSYLHPELATSDYLPEHKKAIKLAKKLGYRVLDNYEEGLFNGYLIGFTDLELNNFKTELWNKLESNNLLYDTSGNPSKDGYLWFDGDYYNKTDWFKPETLTPKDRITGGSRSSWNSGVWSDGPNGNQGFLTRYEMRPILKPYIEVGPLQVNNVLTYANGGPIISPYGQWKYPGKDTIIPSNNITMDNVNYPVLGVSDTGDTKVMIPWNNYKFRGSIVYEHPLIGNQFQLGGLAKPFSYGDIPDVRYLKGGKTQKYLNVPDYNVALYNTVSPLGDFPNFWGALAYRRLVKDKLKNGNIYERDYKVGDTQGEKTAMAAWAKRLGIPYDEQDLPVYNGDTITLPYSLVLEIPYDTNMLKNRIQLNKALLDKYSKYRYSDVVDAAIKADLYNLDKLRETYKTGKPVGLTEFGWNSRLLVNNGEIIPIEEIQSPLNVLGNYNVRYSPEERRLYYSDEYDFNQFENFVPGEPYRIRGYIDLDNIKDLGGNLFKVGGSGIHINPKNKGRFNATKKRTGKTTEELTHSKNPLTRKRAIFAQNAKRWNHKHDEGGYLYSEGGFLLAPYLDIE